MKKHVFFVIFSLACITIFACAKNKVHNRNEYLENMNTPSLKINFSESDSGYNYKLVLDSMFEIYDFNFRKNIENSVNKINTYQFYKSINIFDYIYVPAEKKIYVLIDESGAINMYEFYYNPEEKEIGKIKNKEKSIFSYRKRKMDVTTISANSMCLRYYSDNLFLFLNIPSSQIKIIEIPLDVYQKPSKIILKEIDRFKESEIQPILNTSSTGIVRINNILNSKLKKCSSFSTNSGFELSFILHDYKTETTIDNNGKQMYLSERFFFGTIKSKPIVIQYKNLNWIFYEYDRVSIDPDKLIN